MPDLTLSVFRGTDKGGEFVEFTVEHGINGVKHQDDTVVLDLLHLLQATQAGDLAVRWNCKSGRCGSCSVEINGHPQLACATRVADLPPGPITIAPMKAFPVVKDLVCDVAYNYEVSKKIPAVQLREPDNDDDWRTIHQIDIERSRELGRCIECFLCQDVCHVIRDHGPEPASYAGPRYFARLAEIAWHPLLNNSREPATPAVSKNPGGLGLCNVTRCCTDVCPEGIRITDDAIIPLKERVVSEHYDPVLWVLRQLRRPRARDG